MCLKKATKCIGVYIQKSFGRKKVYADISVENRWGMGEKEKFLTFRFTAFGLNYFFLQQRKYFIRKASFTTASDKTETQDKAKLTLRS